MSLRITSFVVSRLFAHFPFTGPPICQALALDALGGQYGALHVCDMTGVAAKIEFAQLPLEMLG